MKLIAFIFVAVSVVLPIMADNIYIAQSSAGSDSGVDAANAHSVAWLNSASNWGVDPSDVKVGDTVILNGTITNTIEVMASGTESSRITIRFNTNAVMK